MDQEPNARAVIETDVVAVQEDDEGVPSRVNDYAVLNMLGEGSFSKVYHCKNDRGEEYALKILKKSFLKRKREYKKVEGKIVFCNALQKVQREVAIMKKLSHTNLVKLHEIIDSPADDKMFLVLELVQGGQVMNWDDKAFQYRTLDTPSGVLQKQDARNCMRDVVMALSYLHANHICHRDIKPENILLTNSNVFKLADFGVAHILDEENKTLLRSTEGTYHFLAPECTTGDEYDPFQVDIWALGVTLFAMLQGTLPFGTKAASLTQVMDSIREDPLVFGPKIEQDCADVIRLMLEKDPSKRIRIQELKSHPWITEGSERVRFNRSNSVVIEVSQQEIEAAFTPVNNFILMTKLKMKMSSRLARARKSVELRHDISLASVRKSSVEGVVAADPTTTAVVVIEESGVDCSALRPPLEVATAPLGDAPHLAVVLVKRRSSSLLKSVPDERDSLVSATTAPGMGGSTVTLNETTVVEALPRVQAAHHSETSIVSEDMHSGKNLIPSLKTPLASSPLSHRLSRGLSVNTGVPIATSEPRLPPLELSLSASSSPVNSPTSSSTNRERSSMDTFDSSLRRGSGDACSSPSSRTSPEHCRNCNTDTGARASSVQPMVRSKLSPESSSTADAVSLSSRSAEGYRKILHSDLTGGGTTKYKDGVLPAPEPSVMLKHRKSGSLAPASEDTYTQALAEAKRKSSLAQRVHSTSVGNSINTQVEDTSVVKIPLSTEPEVAAAVLLETKTLWSSGSESVLIPLFLSPHSPSRISLRTDSLVLASSPDDSPQTTERDELAPGPHLMLRMSSIVKALGECVDEEHQATNDTKSSTHRRSEEVKVPELGVGTSARSSTSTSERSPKLLFQKRNSNITTFSDPNDNSNAFSETIIGGSSPPKYHEPPSPTATAAMQKQQQESHHQQQQYQWEGSSFGDLEHEVSVESLDSSSKPRRGTFIRVFSKRKPLLEAQDSLQMLLRRRGSAKLMIQDSRGSEAYESKVFDTTANSTIANVAENASHRHKQRLSAARTGPMMAAHSDPTTSALVRSSSQTSQEDLRLRSTLRTQKTVACNIIKASKQKTKKKEPSDGLGLERALLYVAGAVLTRTDVLCMCARDLYSEGYPLSQGYGDEPTTLTGENKPRILLMGLRRSGKSSIQRVVFHKMSPHETLFLEGTNSLDIKYIANNSFVQFQIWDFPGDYDFKEDLVYGGQLVNEEMIFGNCGSIVFVIDAQDEPYAEALARLHDTVIRAHRYNPDIFFEVFIHKVDGDLFLSDDHKIDCQREIQQQITDELSDNELEIHMSFYLTSIYDHSIFEAFSKVVQKLIPQLPTLENLLNILITSCNMEKSFLFDVVSKVYIATDSNPVDMQSYELCSDMIDVVIDVSCIYGMKDDGDGDGLAYDSESSSVIKLNNGMVLYLREVNNYLALVCLLRAENFMKQGIIDYNIDCFKSAIGDVFKVPEKNRIVN